MIIIFIKLNGDNENVYRFKINTNRFRIHYKISDIKKFNCPILGSSAKEGILVLYKHPVKDVWTNIKTFNKSGNANINLSQSVDNHVFYEVMIYSPLLADMHEVTVEFGDRYEVIQSDNPKESLLVMGGQKTFGIGCTTTGTMFSNIIGRKFNCNIVNVSSVDNDYLERLNNYLDNQSNEKQYKIGIIELDYLNDNDNIALNSIIDAMNLCCENVIGWYAFNDSNSKKDLINQILNDKIKNGLIAIEDMSMIFNEDKDMCSYDDEHINDAGNVLIYKKLSSLIKGVL